MPPPRKRVVAARQREAAKRLKRTVGVSTHELAPALAAGHDDRDRDSNEEDCDTRIGSCNMSCDQSGGQLPSDSSNDKEEERAEEKEEELATTVLWPLFSGETPKVSCSSPWLHTRTHSANAMLSVKVRARFQPHSGPHLPHAKSSLDLIAKA
ncbi:hypothetical protein JCM11491_006484 [Sporobolomyces phaffii]